VWNGTSIIRPATLRARSQTPGRLARRHGQMSDGTRLAPAAYLLLNWTRVRHSVLLGLLAAGCLSQQCHPEPSAESPRAPISQGSPCFQPLAAPPEKRDHVEVGRDVAHSEASLQTVKPSSPDCHQTGRPEGSEDSWFTGWFHDDKAEAVRVRAVDPKSVERAAALLRDQSALRLPASQISDF